MKENETSVLEQYHIDVRSTQRIRGAVLCNTNLGLFLLKELKLSEKRVPMLYKLCMYLNEKGYGMVDGIIKNEEDELVSCSEDGTKYILKKWFDGKECDMKRESDLLEAVRNLAYIHSIMRGEIDWGEGSEKFILAGEDQRNEYYRHNRELRKVRTFIRGRVGKGDFELTFLEHFDAMYEWAEMAGKQLEKSGYEKLFRESHERKTITHGDYNYHNVLMTAQGIATTNFDHFHEDVQVSDLYYFLRKTMEKHQWDEKLGSKMLEVYSSVKTLSKEELEYLAICLAYPEKFWKAANSYYRSSKAWMPVKNFEKLEVAIRQTEEKKQFLKTIFSFHL